MQRVTIITDTSITITNIKSITIMKKRSTTIMLTLMLNINIKKMKACLKGLDLKVKMK
jgi:hypothetical protein